MKTPPPTKTPPINLVIPNTTTLKLQSILALSEATKSLAQALASTNVSVTISHNEILGADTGINVSMAQELQSTGVEDDQ